MAGAEICLYSRLRIICIAGCFGSQVNFYISAIDDLVRHPDDQQTIGLILCTSKSKTVVEYALCNLNTPIGVATHRLSKEFEESLPSVEQLEMELEQALSERC